MRTVRSISSFVPRRVALLALSFAAMGVTFFGSEPKILAEDNSILVVVTNKNNTVKALTREELRPLFQTTKTEWSDGSKAVPVNLPEDNAMRQRFDLAVLGLDAERVERYWIDRKIRGGERPPRKVPSSGAVLRVVSAEKGGIGYVASGEADSSVRVVAKIHNGQVTPP